MGENLQQDMVDNMNRKDESKRIAIALRRKGNSYSEIIQKMRAMGIKISRGSLSGWLREITLTRAQLARLEELEEEGKSKGRKKIVSMRRSCDDDS